MDGFDAEQPLPEMVMGRQNSGELLAQEVSICMYVCVSLSLYILMMDNIHRTFR